MQKTGLVPDRMDKANAFTALMEREADGVLRLCYVILQDRMLAEDVMQDVFLKAYRHMDELREPKHQKTWLMRIAINACRDMRRSAFMRHVNRAVSLEELPPAVCEFTEEDDSILREVMRLEPKHREVILLFYYQDMPAEACARALRITRSGFYRRLKKAQSALKPRLERWVFDE